MVIIEGREQFQTDTGSAVAIGKFDGMHLGHQKLIASLLADAARMGGLQTVVFTFEPSPLVFFSGKQEPQLYTREEKRRAFEAMGVQVLVEFPLNARTAAIPPEAFITDILHGMLKMRHVAAGTDLSFGFRGAGDMALMERMSGAYGYTTRSIDKVCLHDREISSTYVREEILAGRMEEAALLLGAPYRITGTVTHGRQLGRSMGIPTVNLSPLPEKLLPPYGVYLSEVTVRDRTYAGVANIGVKPTVKDDNVANVEAFLFDFEGDLYDTYIEVRLLSYLRPERAFPDIDALRTQIEEDISAAHTYFSLHPVKGMIKS